MKIRKVLAVVMAATVIGVFALQSSAYTSLPYSENSHKKVGSATNHNAVARYMHVNNSYSSGTGGVYLSIENYGGTHYYGRKLFPYATTVSDLVKSVPGETTRYCFVQPHQSGQTVSGSYVYEFSLSS